LNRRTVSRAPIRVSAAQPSSLADRRKWALRQGTRLWLWPEVDRGQWHAALASIEEISGAILRGERSQALDGNPQAVGLAGYTSGMGPMLGWWLHTGALSASSADIQDICLHQLQANVLRMEALFARALGLAQRFSEAGISLTVLKGIHTSQVYFPAAGCRPMTDIDVLVSPQDSPRARRILADIGYRQTSSARLESTWTMPDASAEPRSVVSLEADDPWSVDLHVSLDVPGPPGSSSARLSERQSEIEPWAAFPCASQLKQPILLLHVAAHAGSGFHSLTLLRLFEIVLIARKAGEDDPSFWQRFVALGEATHGLAFAFPALALAQRLSPADIPLAVVERCRREAPSRVAALVDELRPATAHRILAPSLREHFAWTQGVGGWLRRLADDMAPSPRSLRHSAAIHLARARGLLLARD
jgi:hypothetical protein